MTHFLSLSSRFSMCSMHLLNILSFCLSLSQYFIISLYLSILVCLYYFKHVSRNKKVSFHQVFFSPSKSLCEIVNEMKEKYVDIEFMNEKFKQWYVNSNYPFSSGWDLILSKLPFMEFFGIIKKCIEIPFWILYLAHDAANYIFAIAIWKCIKLNDRIDDEIIWYVKYYKRTLWRTYDMWFKKKTC